jgi:hypothetical protein
MRQQNDQNSPTKKSSAPAAAQIAPFLMADGATLTFVAGRTAGSGVARAGIRLSCPLQVVNFIQTLVG